MIFLIELFKDLGRKGKWDPVTLNGDRVGELSDDVKVGLRDGEVWIKFTFDDSGKPAELEGRIGTGGKEAVARDGTEMTKGRIGGKPIPLMRGFPPKAQFKFAIFLVYEDAGARKEYRFDVKVASS